MDQATESQKIIIKIIADTLRRGAAENAKILDIGCGDCRIIKRVSQEMSVKVIGADIQKHPEAVKDFVFADLDKPLKFENNSFEIVISTGTMHLVNADIALSEIYRILKPGGTFIVCCPNVFSLLGRISFLIGRVPGGMNYRKFGYKYYFNKNSMKNMLGNAGFVECKLHRVGLAKRLKFLPSSFFSVWLFTGKKKDNSTTKEA